MSGALYRAERCRDLVEEFRHLSEMCTSLDSKCESTIRKWRSITAR
jgi:hypothetical protein